MAALQVFALKLGFLAPPLPRVSPQGLGAAGPGSPKALRCRPPGARRFTAGHVWVFASVHLPLGGPNPWPASFPVWNQRQKCTAHSGPCARTGENAPRPPGGTVLSGGSVQSWTSPLPGVQPGGGGVGGGGRKVTNVT